MPDIKNVAGIYILDVPFQADREYTYLIPDDMRETLEKGRLVCVPFGRGNKPCSGVVSSVYYKADTLRLKTISGFFKNCIVDKVGDEIFSLCAYMKETCFCSFGEALRCMFPGGSLGSVNSEYFALESNIPLPSGVAYSKVYDYIKLKNAEKNCGVMRDELEYNFGSDVKNILSVLEAESFIKCSHKIKSNVKEVTTEYVSLSPDISDEKPESIILTAKQKAAYRYIYDYGSCSMRELQDKAGISRAVINGLVKKNILDIVDIRHYRTPYNGEKTVGRENILNAEQNAVYKELSQMCGDKKPSAALLYGVTGSGKTRVMKSVIDDVIKSGRSVIVLVPEISLTPQTVSLFSSFYGNDIAVLHSSLSLGERFDEWERIRENKVKICIGTRSAIFAPFDNLGLIIIDEEQEYTYKSDQSPRYHARDIARFRCNYHSAVMLLSSATPSIESYYKAKNGIYKLLELKTRFNGDAVPETFIYDMRGHTPGKPIAPLLEQSLKENIKNGDQSILFINRRGYSNYCSCTICGNIIKCPNCSVSLTYHTKDRSPVLWEDSPSARKDNGYLLCHYCGYRTAIPEKCPECNEPVMHYTGYGTQYVEKEIKKSIEGAVVLRLDADTTKTKYSFDSLLDSFRHGKENIMLGTQMVTKGHDFPNVTLVGVISADCGVCGSDYRANERIFSLITQVIGRAGRADKPGRAIIQTSTPDSRTIRLAAKQDYNAFYENEIALRHALTFPPYCDLALITLSSEDEKALDNAVKVCCDSIKELLSSEFGDVKIQIFGPLEAPIYRLRERMRMRIVIKCKANKRTREFLSRVLSGNGKNIASAVHMSVDINPSDI